MKGHAYLNKPVASLFRFHSYFLVQASITYVHKHFPISNTSCFPNLFEIIFAWFLLWLLYIIFFYLTIIAVIFTTKRRSLFKFFKESVFKFQQHIFIRMYFYNTCQLWIASKILIRFPFSRQSYSTAVNGSRNVIGTLYCWKLLNIYQISFLTERKVKMLTNSPDDFLTLSRSMPNFYIP